MNEVEMLDEIALSTVIDDPDIEVVDAPIDFNPPHGENTAEETEI